VFLSNNTGLVSNIRFGNRSLHQYRYCYLPTALFAKKNNSNLWDSIIHRFVLNHHNLEPLGLAKNMASTVAKLLIPKYADWKKNRKLDWTMLFQMRCFGTAVLKPLNVTGYGNWPFNKITFFASEAPGFKETFRLIPLLYPLPSCETLPLTWFLEDQLIFFIDKFP